MRKVLLLFNVLLILLGCTDNSNEPVTPSLTVDMVKGNYSTIVFNLTENTTLTDILAAGGFININLLSDRTTTGQFFIPKVISGDSSDTNLNLEGTFSIINDSVEFQQNADTFIRDIKWAFKENKLTGKFVSSSTIIFVQLQK